MKSEPRNLTEEARDLASGKKVNAALPRGLGYRRVATTWLWEVVQELRDAEYNEKALKLALKFSPEIRPCPDCGNPKAEGIRCTSCPPPKPKTQAEEHPDWKVEVMWDNDHGWLISEPREDDGEMEAWDPPWDVEGRIKKKQAIEWGIDRAKERKLPLRIYHKHSPRITDIPLCDLK